MFQENTGIDVVTTSLIFKKLSNDTKLNTLDSANGIPAEHHLEELSMSGCVGAEHTIQNVHKNMSFLLK